MKSALKNKLKAALEKSKSKESPSVAPVAPVVAKSIVAKKTSNSQKKKTPKLSALQSKMASKLSGSKFRMLNESLYTSRSDASFARFDAQQELFDIYHAGFREQVALWPVNPLDLLISRIKDRVADSASTKLVIADMGCGEAGLAKAVTSESVIVHSFDLVKGNEYITACDIANVPLEKDAVDIVVFCLALMGTNFPDFLREAKRILKVGGELMVAEVVSRIDDLKVFIKAIEAMGFKLTQKETNNKMFVMLQFVKLKSVQQDTPSSSSTASDQDPLVLRLNAYRASTRGGSTGCNCMPI